jgi:hypothetical protein
MISALPRSLKMSIAPAVPSWTTTTFVVVLPAGGLMFDVPALPEPTGYKVRKVDVVTLTTVMFMTIAVAFAGIPFAPPTVHDSVLPDVRCQAN